MHSPRDLCYTAPVMAIITLGELITGIRGSIGGTVFSANVAGPYARSWTQGPHRHTPSQETIRAVHARLGEAWQGLSDAQRTDWDDFAALDPEPTYNSLGEEIHLSGWQYFVRINTRRHGLALDITEDVPPAGKKTPPGVLTPDTLTLTEPGSGDSTLTWLATNTDSDRYAVACLHMRPTPFSATPDSGYYLMCKHLSTDLTATFTTALQAAFGDIRSGWYGRILLYNLYESGLQSTATKISATVT